MSDQSHQVKVTMVDSDSPKRRPSRRDRDRDRDRDRPGRDRLGGRPRDRDSPRGSEKRDNNRRDAEDLIPYHDSPDEPRDRKGRPVAHRRSTYNDGNGADEYYDDDDDDDNNDNDDKNNYSNNNDNNNDSPRSSDRRRRRRGQGSRRRSPSETRSITSDTPGRHRSEGGDRDRDRDRGRGRGRGRDRPPLTEEETKKKRNQAIKAALTAGAIEAWRQKDRPGEWMGQKGVRVATAAISAGVIDAGLDKDPGSGTMGRLMKSAIGGLMVDKIANGGRR